MNFLLEENNVNPNLIMQPRQQNLHKRVRTMLLAFGMWPARAMDGEDVRWSTLHSVFLTGLFSSTPVFYGLYLYNDEGASFDKKCHMYSDLILNLVVLVRILTEWTEPYKQIIVKFYNEVHLSNYKFHTEATIKILLKVERDCYKLLLFVLTCVTFGAMFYVLTPTLTNVLNGAFNKNSTTELVSPLYFALPFDYKYDVTNWCLMHVAFFYVSYAFSYLLMSFDMFMLFYVNHLLGHLSVIASDLDCLRSDELMLTREEDDAMYDEMKKIINHHTFTLDALRYLESVFGVVMLVNYVYDMVAFCVLLVAMFDNWPFGVVSFGVLNLVIFTQLIGESYAMEKLSESMEELNRAVNRVSWTGMSLRNKKAYCIMVMVTQKPYFFKGVIFNVNLANMAAILKSIVSYFMWLNAMGSSGH